MSQLWEVNTQSQSYRLHHDDPHLQTQPMSIPSVNFQHLMVSKINPRTRFSNKMSLRKEEVKSRSHHYVAHLHTLTNVPTKYQLPTPYYHIQQASDESGFEGNLFPGAPCRSGSYIEGHTEGATLCLFPCLCKPQLWCCLVLV